MRVPLAMLFLIDSVWVRVSAVILALFSDGLDGYLARRNRTATQLGALLDPVMDKIFVLFTGSVLLAEGGLSVPQLLCLMSRDVSVAIFGIYLVLAGRLGKVEFQSIWSGKVSTLGQFAVLALVCVGYTIPAFAYGFFVVLAVTALLELFFIHGTTRKNA